MFADRVYSDSWYSRFFAKDLSEDHHHLFRIKWIQRLVANGLKKVWISIDGSNNDCEARNSYLAKYGFPKSHNKNRTIVGYMYAVDAESGMPITYLVYEGSVPDSQAFQKMATFLESFELEIEGIILDRGFAVEPVFQMIEKNQWKYVVMLPSDTYGHTELFKMYKEDIRWKSKYVLNNGALFGISDIAQISKEHDRKSNICLFFDGAGGSIQSVRLIKEIQTAKKRAEKAIAAGSRASIANKYQKYLSITGEGFNRKVVPDYEYWDKSMESKGYHSLAVSEGITPNRANELYKMRDVSETQFSILKTQEDCAATRVHKTEGIYSKFALSFISSIIRFEIERACMALDFDTNPTITGLRSIEFLYTAENKYEFVRNLTTDQKKLFEFIGFDQDDFERMARDYNNRKNKDSNNQYRELNRDIPIIHSNTRKVGRPVSVNTADINQSEDRTENCQSSDKSKGGRPKGKKDTVPRKPRSDKGKKRGPRSSNLNP